MGVCTRKSATVIDWRILSHPGSLIGLTDLAGSIILDQHFPTPRLPDWVDVLRCVNLDVGFARTSRVPGPDSIIGSAFPRNHSRPVCVCVSREQTTGTATRADEFSRLVAFPPLGL